MFALTCAHTNEISERDDMPHPSRRSLSPFSQKIGNSPSQPFSPTSLFLAEGEIALNPADQMILPPLVEHRIFFRANGGFCPSCLIKGEIVLIGETGEFLPLSFDSGGLSLTGSLLTFRQNHPLSSTRQTLTPLHPWPPSPPPPPTSRPISTPPSFRHGPCRRA